MAEVVLGVGIKKLSTFLSEQGALLGGLNGEDLQFISDELGHIQAFLEKMANFNQENEDVQLAVWIRQVRDVSYDIQDIIDEYPVLFARRLPGLHGFMRWSFQSAKSFPARDRLASKLKSVVARIKNMPEARIRYESQYASIISHSQVIERVAASTAKRNDDALLVEEAQLVGIDVSKNHLIHHLVHPGDSKLEAIAVLGMGGLGKTTLARRVYEDAVVKSHFLIRAWVVVSQKWVIEDVLKKLIQQLCQQFNEQIPPTMDSMESHELKAIVKGFLHRGRYAVVFDDVWDTEFCHEMNVVLPENSYGGNRVMSTTRIAGVAAVSNGYVYRLKCLNFQDSWNLFCNKIFKGNPCPVDLEDVAESIVAKCGGLPLGIVAISGLLASKDPGTKSEWELIRDRLGDEFEETGKLGQLKRIFTLSYNDLPFTLKACLLYTSTFSPGQNMNSEYLVRMLVAEGFVEPKGARTDVDIAQDCLKQLADRSLIQPYNIRYNGQFQFISIHDLLREFISLKSKEQNMVTMVSSTEPISGWHSKKVVRRLVLDHSLLEIPTIASHQNINKCRSIINFGKRESPSKVVLAKLLSSNLLTIVDLSGIGLEEIPKNIFKLLQLKFLSISGKGIKTVPKSIHRLQNLQFLSLLDTSVTELPVEIQKLHKLRHLKLEHKHLELFQVANDTGLGRKGFKAPHGMGELVELETLDAIDAAGMMSEIGKLTKLRMLCITNLRTEDGEELCFSLNKLKSLQVLIVVSSVKGDEVVSFDLNHPMYDTSLQSLRMLELFGCLESIPTWIRTLRRLEEITLCLSNLAEDPLETLQHLPNLLSIWLMTDSYQGESLCFKAGHYLKLKELRLRYIKGLTSVRIEKGAMPGINKLWMEGLPLLEELPVGIQHLRQLERLDFWDMNLRLIEKLEGVADSEKQSEDYEKVSHIPQVTIGSKKGGKSESHRLSRKIMWKSD